MTLLDVLSTTPQTKRELASKVGCTPREVELEVNRLRLDGAEIISDSSGYRLGASAAEVDACADRLRVRAIHQLLTSRALRRTARCMAAAEHRRPEWPKWDGA